MFIMSFSIVALGVGMGARLPRFRAENAPPIAASSGGILYMNVAMGYVIFVLTALFFPTRSFYQNHELPWKDWPFMDWLQAGILFGVVGLTSLILIFIAMRAGAKNLDRLERI